MTANRRREPNDQELGRAVEILSRADADEDAIDTALETLVGLSSAPAPPKDFSRRVMLAVGQAPLAAGRRSLAAPRPDWPRVVGSLGAAAAAVAGGAVGLFGPAATPALVSMGVLLIGTPHWLVASVARGLRIWSATATAGAALADALTSPQLAIGLAATMLVGVISLMALTQLLATEREASRWPNNASLFV